MDYRDYMPRVLAPGWMSRPKGAAWLRASGDLKDSIAERCKLAVKSRFARLAPPDGLSQIGGERRIEQAPIDTRATLAERVAHAWRLWAWGGTATGLLTALRDGGYPGAKLEIVNGVQYGLDGDGALVITALPVGSWLVDSTPAHWSSFVVLFPMNPFTPVVGPITFEGAGEDLISVPDGTPTGYYDVVIRCSVAGHAGAGAEVEVSLDGGGDMGSWGPSTALAAGTNDLDSLGALAVTSGLTVDVDGGVGLDLTEGDTWSFPAYAGPHESDPAVGGLLRLIRRWKSAHARCREIVVITAGRTWGYPFRTWTVNAGGNWDGNVVMRYLVTL